MKAQDEEYVEVYGLVNIDAADDNEMIADF